MIYADHAATTRISPVAQEEMLRIQNKCWGNPSSLYGLGRQASAELQTARESIAACLGASPKEIYFTSGGSESDNQAIRSAAHAGKKNGKCHLISSGIEHHAVLETLHQLELEGFQVTFLPVGADGVVTCSALASAIREDTALVTIMAANNEIGTIQPIKELALLCRERGILFHTDAVQAAGHLPLNMQELPVDYLSLSAHKFHGPRGTGVLYVRDRAPLESLILGGSQERSRRAGTENLPAIVGMAAALKEACARSEADHNALLALREELIDGLLTIPGCTLNGSRQQRLPGNVNVSFEGINSEMLLLILDQKGVAASAGSACTSGSLKPSHVLLALGQEPSLASGSLRLTIDYENQPEDIPAILHAVRESVSFLRSMQGI
jgi:cysteine desulfurase